MFTANLEFIIAQVKLYSPQKKFHKSAFLYVELVLALLPEPNSHQKVK